MKLSCPICDLELLGQDKCPLKRCERCCLWFELQDDGKLIPLRIDNLAKYL